MQYIKQDDYDDFKCICGDCPNSCCKGGWEIAIDDEALDRFKSMDGELGEKVRHAIDIEEAVILQKNRSCALLDENGLCSLQIAAGEEALCEVCRMFPRHIEEFEDVREFSLSMACPEVANMLVRRTSPVKFVEYEDDALDDFEDFDYLLYTKLTDARDIIYKIAQNRSWSIEYRCEAILELAREIQKCVDEDRLFDTDEVLDSFYDKVSKKYREKKKNIIKTVDVEILEKMELLDDDWKSVISSMRKYRQKSDEIELNSSEEITAENMLVLLIYTYFCGAVYDEWIFAKAKLCVESMRWTLLIYKSTDFTLEEAIYRYSREIEHSDLNLDALEEYFMDSIE